MITACRLYSYQLRLTSPVQLAGQVLHHRDGLLLALADDEGHEGWGDIAPLPGFSRETFEEASQQARNTCAVLAAHAFDREHPVLRALSPSVRFGFDSAWMSLAAGGHAVGAGQQIGGKNTRVPVCALLAGSTETCLADLFRAAARGVRTFKLKVGRGTVDEEADRIRRMHEALPRDAVLRLDANRAWSLATARELARRLPQVQPVFVEEPLAEVARLRDFYDATGWPLALDETLHGLRPDQEVSAIPGVVAWVLKPTLMRCLEDVMSWQDKAAQAGVDAIISASYESGVGIRMLAELAGRSPETAAGLDTYRFLAEDVLEPQLDIDSGVIDLRDARALAVQTLRLKRVS